MSRRSYKQRRRAELYGEQNGACYWCERTMILMGRYPIGGDLPRNACTIDHLRDRDNPRRREQPQGEARLVAACFECNQERDKARQRVNSKNWQEIRA